MPTESASWGWTTWVLIVVALLAGLQLLRLVLVLLDLLRHVLQRPAYRRVDEAAVPPAVREGLASVVELLRGQGFERLGHLAVRRLFTADAVPAEAATTWPEPAGEALALGCPADPEAAWRTWRAQPVPADDPSATWVHTWLLGQFASERQAEAAGSLLGARDDEARLVRVENALLVEWAAAASYEIKLTTIEIDSSGSCHILSPSRGARAGAPVGATHPIRVCLISYHPPPRTSRRCASTLVARRGRGPAARGTAARPQHPARAERGADRGHHRRRERARAAHRRRLAVPGQRRRRPPAAAAGSGRRAQPEAAAGGAGSHRAATPRPGF